jgi:hypothetical protein
MGVEGPVRICGFRVFCCGYVIFACSWGGGGDGGGRLFFERKSSGSRTECIPHIYVSNPVYYNTGKAVFVAVNLFTVYFEIL